MEPKSFYRLGEYRIQEFGDGRLWWESHAGFGIQVGGPCYLWDQMLLMGAKRSEKIGFLKSEFLDSLKKLPRWRKTRFYCPASALLEVPHTHPARETNLMRKRPGSSHPRSNLESVGIDKPVCFRLGHYRLAITPGGGLRWHGSGGGHRIISGPVVIESDILFLCGRVEEETRQDKRAFLSALQGLPIWDRTTFWCRSLALKSVATADKQVSCPIPTAATISTKWLPVDRARRPDRHPWSCLPRVSALLALAREADAKRMVADWAKKIRAIGKKIRRMPGLKDRN